jgi:hypothetical protein
MCAMYIHHQGGGVVLPRNGGSMSRVGMFGRLQNKRHAENALDFSTNVEVIETFYVVNDTV